MTPAYRYRASCVRVIDADTYVLTVDLGFRCAVQINGRLRGVNAPELGTVEGEEAKRLASTLLVGPLVVESYKDHQSFARWVVDVYLPDGSNLADRLVEAGAAQPVT